MIRRFSRGLTMSMDALVAATLLLSMMAILGAVRYSSSQPQDAFESFYYNSRDIVVTMQTAKLRDIQDFPIIQSLLASEDPNTRLVEADMDKSVLDIIGAYWATGNTSIANNITRTFLEGFLPVNFGFDVVLDGTSIYNNSRQMGPFVSKTNFLVSGLKKEAAVEGYVSSAWLTKATANDTIIVSISPAGAAFSGSAFSGSAYSVVWNNSVFANSLYAGGGFTNIGYSTVYRVASLGDVGWANLTSSGMSSTVRSLVFWNGSLIAGGDFNTAGGVTVNRVARWDGFVWNQMGNGFSGSVAAPTPPARVVYAMAFWNGNVYAGGIFNSTGGVLANNTAMWDGAVWSALGTGMNNTVRAFAVWNNSLYAGGDFTTAGGIPASRIARWNGSVWRNLSTGVDGSVYALAVWNGSLYVGGSFTNAGGVAANRVARWNGSWSALGGGITNGVVRSLAVWNGSLYAGGTFTTADGGLVVNRTARWNGSGWSALDLGMNNEVYALAVWNDSLYAGGAFYPVPTTVVSENESVTTYSGLFNRTARWNGSGWSAVGLGMNNYVWSLGVWNGSLYAGGYFSSADGGAAARVARWNGSGWSALGSGTDLYVYSLVNGTAGLYAGGDFTTPGNRTALWSGSVWSRLGSGIPSPPQPPAGITPEVHSLVVWNGTLYAGGNFYSSGNVSVNYTAFWDGSAWAPLGSGMNGRVRSLAVWNNSLVAGGEFTTAGGGAAERVARWNGTSWSAVGAGMVNTVYSLVDWNGSLFVGGSFTNVGSSSGDRIVRWTGSSWGALSSGISTGEVRSLAVWNDSLYLGGSFTNVGNGNGDYVVQWNGTGWRNLSTGRTSTVYSLYATDAGLYAGGSFYGVVSFWNGEDWTAVGSGFEIIKAFSLPASATNISATLYASIHEAMGGTARKVAVYVNNKLQFSIMTNTDEYIATPVFNVAPGNNTLQLRMDVPDSWNAHIHPGFSLRVNYQAEKELSYALPRENLERIYSPYAEGNPAVYVIVPFNVLEGSTINNATFHFEGRGVNVRASVEVNNYTAWTGSTPNPSVNMNILNFLRKNGSISTGETNVVGIYLDLNASDTSNKYTGALDLATILNTSYVELNYTLPQKIMRYGFLPISQVVYANISIAGSGKRANWTLPASGFADTYLHIVQSVSEFIEVAAWHDPEPTPTWLVSDKWSNYTVFSSPGMRNVPADIFLPPSRLNSNTSNLVMVRDRNDREVTVNTTVSYVTFAPVQVGYGAVFANETNATNDARDRLTAVLNEYKVTVNLADIQYSTQATAKVPWMWGPAVLEVRIWT